MGKKRRFKTCYDFLFGDAFLNFRDDMLNKSDSPEKTQLWDEEIYNIYKTDFSRLKHFFHKLIK